MRPISEIIENTIHVKRPLASGWADLSRCSGRGPWTWLAYLPAQGWSVFLLRKSVPDWTGLSPSSGTGSQTRLACLSAQEEGLRLDWPPCSRKGTWTLQEPLLSCLSQLLINISLFKIIRNIIISISSGGQSDTCIFQDTKNIKHQWANTSTYSI